MVLTLSIGDCRSLEAYSYWPYGSILLRFLHEMCSGQSTEPL